MVSKDPYRLTSLAVADLMVGQAQVVFADPVSVLAPVRAGTLIARAITSKDRSAVVADIPTIAESGYPGFDAIAWPAIPAPAGTPPAILQGSIGRSSRGSRNRRPSR